MLNLEALEEVYVALGGDSKDFTATTNAEGIHLISTVASSGGGSGLPSVTSADNGDVLTVVEGAWAKAEATKELPAVTSSNNGQVLMVVDGEWAVANLPD